MGYRSRGGSSFLLRARDSQLVSRSLKKDGAFLFPLGFFRESQSDSLELSVRKGFRLSKRNWKSRNHE
ncbi:hypothetical protein LEP1GSC061_2205 [Leptospira wolffii serovar Khorat str. Khorat-H2]|nr:hypothetical protein LEP1GSC061_2205 [Leptospira wolffii serovar Khorat str. Khorat-H2]